MVLPNHLVETQAELQRRRRGWIAIVVLSLAGLLFFTIILPKIRTNLFARHLRSIGSTYTERVELSGHSAYSSHRVTTIVLRGSHIDDEWVKANKQQLSQLRHLDLELEETQCGCESLRAIGEMENLRSLTLDSKTISDDCVVKYVRPMRLVIEETGMSDAGVAALITLSGYEPGVLTFPNKLFGPKSIAALKSAPSTRELIINGATDHTVAMLVGTQSPTYITLQGRGITDASISNLLELKSKLSLRGHSLSMKGIETVRQKTKFVTFEAPLTASRT